MSSNRVNTDPPERQRQEPRHRKPRRTLKIVLTALLSLIVVGAVGFGIYVSDYYHADSAALEAMESTKSVSVHRLDNGDIAFEPADPQAGIVFYPGGKVQAEAYAPLMQSLADRGFLCVVVPMPFNLAVLNVNGADGVQQQFPSVQKWILMGHSLGGAIAATYVDSHASSWDGLVLLGAYSTVDLTGDDLSVLSVIGGNDGVLNRDAANENASNLGEEGREFDIPGGNHAQFGSYGPQAGDGDATISPEEQQSLTADEVASIFLGNAQ